MHTGPEKMLYNPHKVLLVIIKCHANPSSIVFSFQVLDRLTFMTGGSITQSAYSRKKNPFRRMDLQFMIAAFA